MKSVTEFDCREDFLFYLFNDLGHENLRLSYNYFKNGEKYFSKHILYKDIMGLNQNDFVPGTIDTRKTFIDKAQHRTTFDVEIIIDTDDLQIDKKTLFSNALSKAKWIKKKLDELNYNFLIYKSNKGYHFHMIDERLKFFSSEQRKLFKEQIIKTLGGDFNKSSDNTTIALEGAIHWKSGKLKEEVNL